MSQEQQEIIELISLFLKQNPEQRFGQALHNLDINQFSSKENHDLRDIYNDDDSVILKRLKTQIDALQSNKYK